MGSFANAMFSVLLGWLRNFASWLWRLVTSADAGAWMGWVLDNWLPLTVLLCLGCLVVDFLVYLVRWQPYRVWRSFFRRARDDDEGEEAPPAAQEGPVRQWLYADGTVVTGGTSAVPGAADSDEEPRLEAPLKPVRRVYPAKRRRSLNGEYAMEPQGEQAAYHQPVYPAGWHTGESPLRREDTDDGSAT